MLQLTLSCAVREWFEGGAVVRTTGKESVKLSKKLPNTIRKRLPSPNYQTYLTPYQLQTLAFHTATKWPGLGGGRARERQGKGGKGQAHAPRRLCQAQGGTQGAPWPAEEEKEAPCWPRGPAAARARRCRFGFKRLPHERSSSSMLAADR